MTESGTVEQKTTNLWNFTIQFLTMNLFKYFKLVNLLSCYSKITREVRRKVRAWTGIYVVSKRYETET